MAAFFIAAVCFGAMAVFVRLAAHDMPAMQVACVRFAGSFLLLVALTRGTALRPRPGALPRLLLRGILGGAAITCYYLGIGRAGATLATMLHGTYPVFTAFWSVLLLGETWSVRLLLALVVNGLGAAVVLGAPTALGPGVFSGSLLALLGGFLAGGAVATASDLRRTESASLVTVWFMAVGGAMTAPAFLAGGTHWSPALLSALVGVVVSSAAGQWLLHHGLGFVPPTVGSLASATSVVTAATLEALFVGSRLPASVIAGGALMLIAVALAGRERPTAAADEAVAD